MIRELVPRDRASLHSGRALPMGEPLELAKRVIGPGDDEAAFALQLDRRKVVGELEPQPARPYRQVKLRPRLLVRDEDVALARAGRTCRNPPLVDDDDRQPVAAQVVGTGGTNDPRADDHDIRSLATSHEPNYRDSSS